MLILEPSGYSIGCRTQERIVVSCSMSGSSWSRRPVGSQRPTWVAHSSVHRPTVTRRRRAMTNWVVGGTRFDRQQVTATSHSQVREAAIEQVLLHFASVNVGRRSACQVSQARAQAARENVPRKVQRNGWASCRFQYQTKPRTACCS
jgi:hypothetical protein